MEPCREWEDTGRGKGKPGALQARNIERKMRNVTKYFHMDSRQVIAFSAKEQWRLQELTDRVINTAGESRQGADSRGRPRRS